jgi:hypothetical protein
MAIADRYYVRERPDMTDEEREAEIRRRIDLKYESVTRAAFDFQVKKERAIKLRSMKRYLYGKFIVRVPAFNTDKYVDSPLPESFAKPVSTKTAPMVNITGRKYGQILKGDMIPMRELQQAAAVTKNNNKGGKNDKGMFPLRQLKSAMGFVGRQQPGKPEQQQQQQSRNAMSGAMRLLGGSRQDKQQHEKVPLLSTFTRTFQKGGYQTAVVVSPAHTTSTIMEEDGVNDGGGESSEHHSVASGNSNNDNIIIMTTTPTMETASPVAADTTAHNLTVSTEM